MGFPIAVFIYRGVLLLQINGDVSHAIEGLGLYIANLFQEGIGQRDIEINAVSHAVALAGAFSHG